MATRNPGVGPRAVATIVDGIVGTLVIGVPLLLAFGRKTTTLAPNGTRTTTHSTSDPKVLALWAALALAYYFAFELWLAATPGKLLLGLRVRNADGSRLTASAAALRNLLRLVDAFPYVVPYLAAAVSAWTDGGESPAAARFRRIGDRVAGTVVTYR